MTLPAQVDRAPGPVAELCEVAAHGGAVQRLLFGFELAGRYERLRTGRPELGLREPRVGRQPVRHREACVGRGIRAALVAGVLVLQPAAAHLVRAPQHRCRHARRLRLRIHESHGTGDGGTGPANPPNRPGPVSTLGPVRIAIGGDHAGYPLKQHLVGVLQKWGHAVDDLGTEARRRSTTRRSARRSRGRSRGGGPTPGIVLGGSGQGEQISANKVHGVRAALCNDLYTARMARQHNNANVLSIGARIVAPELAEEIVRIFLDTPFEGGRHQRRIDEIAANRAPRSVE